MISGVHMHYAPCWLPTSLSDVYVEGTSKEDPKWGKSEKAGKVKKRLFQE